MDPTPAQHEPADRGPRACVVIPVRGGLDRLADTLRAVAAQDLPADDFEVVVVDDGTPGGGVEAVAREAAPGLDLRVFRQEPAGPAAARNRGLDAARAPVVAFLDADVLPRAGWLRQGLAVLEGPDPPAAVEGRTVVEPAAERTPFTHQTDNRDGGRYPTCNLFVSRPWLTEHGVRFDERYTVPFREDSDFAFQVLACGGEIRWWPAAEVVHPPVPRGWATALKLAGRYEMDGLLRRRFPKRYWSLDRRCGVSHLRQQVYATGYLAGLAILFSPITMTAEGAGPIENGFGLLMIVLTWAVATLVLYGGRPTRRGLRHLPAAALVALLVPWPWVAARHRGWWRFRGVKPFVPQPK